MKNIRLRSYKDTGTILVEHGLIEAEKVADAAEVQNQSGYSMGRSLVELSLLTEWELARAVSKELAVPFVRLKSVDYVSEACHRLDRSLFHRHTFFLLDNFDGVDTVVVAEPPSLDLLAELSPVLGEKVFILVAPISDVVAILDKALPLEGAIQTQSADSLTAEDILSSFDDD